MAYSSIHMSKNRRRRFQLKIPTLRSVGLESNADANMFYSLHGLCWCSPAWLPASVNQGIAHFSKQNACAITVTKIRARTPPRLCGHSTGSAHGATFFWGTMRRSHAVCSAERTQPH